MNRFLLICGALLLGLLAGCGTTTLRSDVTSFQRWPGNTVGASYSFKPMGAQASSLEHKRYEDLTRAELTKLRLVEARPGTTARFEISLDYGVATQTVRSKEPVWDSPLYWRPPYLHPSLGWQPGYWVRDPFGPRVVGYRSVARDLSTRRLRVDISEGASKVFEASATSSGSDGSLAAVMPYLVRSVFEGFPGTNGQVRVIDYDTERGNLKALSIKAAR